MVNHLDVEVAVACFAENLVVVAAGFIHVTPVQRSNVMPHWTRPRECENNASSTVRSCCGVMRRELQLSRRTYSRDTRGPVIDYVLNVASNQCREAYHYEYDNSVSGSGQTCVELL